jgi:hypothetical protein
MPDQSANPPPNDTDDAPQPATADFAGQFEQLRTYLAYYFLTKFDLARASVRRFIVHTAIISVLVLAMAGAIVTAVVLVLRGFAEAVGSLFSRAWIGDLVCGGGFLTLLVCGLVVVRLQLLDHFRRRTIGSYEKRRERQREKFGTDVHERARANQN